MAKKTKAEDSTVAQDDKQTNPLSSAQAGSGSSVTEGLADSAKQAGSQAKEAAARAFSQAKDEATSRADQGRQTLASGISAVAQAFSSMSEDLKKKEQGPIAEYTAEFGQALGGQVEKLASYLNGRDIKQMIGDTEDFARRSPAAFLGTAFVLVIAASRFFKSSSSQGGSSTKQPSYPNPTTQGQLALPPAPTTPTPTPAYDISSTSAGSTTGAGAPSTQPAKGGSAAPTSAVTTTSGL